jgi:hypothetical protein
MKIDMTNIFLFILIYNLLGCSSNKNIIEDDGKVYIHYKYNFKDELNTFDSTYVKDLVADGADSTKLFLTEAEEAEILKLAYEVNFFELPDTLAYVDDISIIPDPGFQMLRIKYDDKDKTVYWANYDIQNVSNEEFQRAAKLGAFIHSIVIEKKEYKALPPARGGYR